MTLKSFSHPLFNVEPQSGFKIAFNMFDTDGNQRVDKAEFLVVSVFMMNQCLLTFLYSHQHGSQVHQEIIDNDFRRRTTLSDNFKAFYSRT